jgi:hypothetical protein
MSDIEELVRRTFAAREEDVLIPYGLAQTARRQAKRRRGRFAILGSVVAFAAAITVGVAVNADRPVSPDETVAHPAPTPADGDWQWMSSAGAELRVPASWVVDDGKCSPDRFSFGVARRACDATVRGARPLVEINGSEVPKQAGQSVTIDGQSAHRATMTLPGGRSQGIIRFDKLPITVSATLTDTVLLERILDSVTLSAIDHVGCQTRVPSAGRPAASTTATEQMIPPGATEIIACSYSLWNIQASARLDQRQTAGLVAALNSAPAGPNPDRKCLEGPAYPIAVIARYPDRPPVTVHIRFWGCTGRGLDNGTRVSHATRKVLGEVLGGLRAGGAYGGDLPAK